MAESEFYRGFKSYCDKISADCRKDLGLRPYEPLCPWALAENLGIPVLCASSFDLEPDEKMYFSGLGSREFSALTFKAGDRTNSVIIHNDFASRKRQASNIAHELAHVLLQHSPSKIQIDGSKVYDESVEAEANWLGPTLLISKECAYHAHKLEQENGVSISSLSNTWSITPNVIRMRINLTGAAKRYKSSKRRLSA